MKPGEHRTIRHLDPSSGMAQTELTAGKLEPVKLLAGTFDLLRIDTVEKLAEGPKAKELKGAMWTDPSGDGHQNVAGPMDMRASACRRRSRFKETGPAKFDFGTGVAVKLDRPLPDAHETSGSAIASRLEGGDPSKVFENGPSQRVKRIDDHTAEITVYAVRPGKPGNADAPADPPTDADRQPNNFIQSDDAKIVADAKEAVAGLEGAKSWQVAVALEQYVRRVMTKIDFTQAFATAAEVAGTRKGDCKAHALYLAALARARGIPARVAAGLVYIRRGKPSPITCGPRSTSMGGGFPWTAPWARVASAAGISSWPTAAWRASRPTPSFLPVVQVIGRLKIEVLEAE